jgi:hypothetical protein
MSATIVRDLRSDAVAINFLNLLTPPLQEASTRVPSTRVDIFIATNCQVATLLGADRRAINGRAGEGRRWATSAVKANAANQTALLRV